MKSVLNIAQLVSGPAKDNRVGQFYIIEAFMTSDGIRTRIAGCPYKTLEEAEFEMKLREEKMK